jgi:hypothetical protein
VAKDAKKGKRKRNLSIPYSSGPALHLFIILMMKKRMMKLSIPYSSGPALHPFGPLADQPPGKSLSIPYSSGPALHRLLLYVFGDATYPFNPLFIGSSFASRELFSFSFSPPELSIPYSSGPALHRLQFLLVFSLVLVPFHSIPGQLDTPSEHLTSQPPFGPKSAHFLWEKLANPPNFALFGSKALFPSISAFSSIFQAL